MMSFTKPVLPLLFTRKTDGKRRRVNRLLLLLIAALHGGFHIGKSTLEKRR